MRRHRRLFVLVIAALVVSSIVLGLLIGLVNAAAPGAGVRAEVAHVALTLVDGNLAVAQAVEIANDGTEPSQPLTIPIPAEVNNFEVMEGNVTRDGATVTVPGGIAPKATQLAGFRYTLPTGVLQVPFPDVPPADLSMVLVDEATLTLVIPPGSQGFQDLGVTAMGEHAYRQFVVTRPAAGMLVTLTLKVGGNPENAQKALAAAPATGVPAAGGNSGPGLLNRSFHGGNANVMLWQRMTGSPGHGGLPGILVIGLVVTGVVGLIVVVIRRHASAMTAAASPARQARAGGGTGGDTAAPGPNQAALLRRKAELVQEIAAIDRQAAQNPDAAEDLAARRAEAKRKLINVIRLLKDLESRAG